MAEPDPDEGEVLVVAMARPSMVGPFTLSSILSNIQKGPIRISMSWWSAS